MIYVDWITNSTTVTNIFVSGLFVAVSDFFLEVYYREQLHPAVPSTPSLPFLFSFFFLPLSLFLLSSGIPHTIVKNGCCY